ncbi:hemerythrin-like domain-containing protein [Muricomes intestini]|uniref:Hemerythrin-like domain-containing protein n=1 Tax=Muricomes intestini TaxID=1796634 RepID=A0A4R3KG95_9FIRM|nr:hemerythrin domain-containing protein [Muricomes intestini]TCS82195.1 hemerythrin-like domain-containing protein [Muricomes intestini]
MNNIELLKKEHENIQRMLDVVHKASLDVLQNDKIDVDDLKKMVAFIRRYADKTHHGKEEKYLFKAMVKDLGGPAEKVIQGGMLIEHDLGRLYVSDLDEALDSFKEDPSVENKLAILVAAGSYEHLLRRHIQKENETVFTFGEKHLPEKSMERIEEQSQAFEADVENAAEREYQLQVLKELEEKYL